MKILSILAAVGLTLALQGCERPKSLYADAPNVRRAPASPDQPPGYIGRWASTEADCPVRSWTLTATHMQGPDGAACDIVGAAATPAGYSANAMCSGPELAEAKSGRIVMTLTGAEPGESLSITEAPVGAVALVRCMG